VIESGYPGFDVAVWHGLIGPKGIPKGIVDKLNKAVIEALSDPATAEQLATDGLTPAKDSPEVFSQLIEAEVKRWGELVKARGITLK
jgi:tripartite-type tricarboxylate transporter receptor subunit TctC